MAKEKKSSKADKKRGSGSNKNYIAQGRRYVHKMRKVKRHIKRTGDQNAQKWWDGANKIPSMDYKRGAKEVIANHQKVYG